MEKRLASLRGGRTDYHQVIHAHRESKVMRAILFVVFLGLVPGLSSSTMAAEAVEIETLLQTSQSWDGTPYQGYSGGQPEPTLVKFSIPANTTLAWHTHAVINIGYVLSGVLFVEKQNSTDKLVLHAGDSLAELVGIAHRGYTTEQPVELLVFYANSRGLPLSSRVP
nr:cupin domain-containing protein [uncultured Pseudomonas sp.]